MWQGGDQPFSHLPPAFSTLRTWPRIHTGSNQLGLRHPALLEFVVEVVDDGLELLSRRYRGLPECIDCTLKCAL